MTDADDEEQRERYRELLEELRTIIPGVEVLFAFLLTVPFAARFSEIDLLGRIIFTFSLISVAGATILFLAPTSYHRLVDHRNRKARLRFGIRATLFGLSLLALAITCAILVVMRFLFGWLVGVILAGAVAMFATSLWYFYPLSKNRGGDGWSR